MAKDVIGGVTFGELAKAAFEFFKDLKKEYKDDQRLDPDEILGCVADLFAKLEDEADDVIYQRVFGTISGVCDLVGGLMGSGEIKDLLSPMHNRITNE